MTTQSQEMKALRSEVDRLTEKLEKGLKSPSNNSADIIGFDRRDIQRAARKAGRNVRHFFDEKSKQAVELRDNYEDAVAAHPYKSMLAVLTGGLVLGMLLRK